MKKKTVNKILTAAGLLVYIVVAVAWSVGAVNGAECREVKIIVHDGGPADTTGFVTPEGVISDLRGFYENAQGEKLANIDLERVSKILNSNDRYESASVMIVPTEARHGESGALKCDIKIEVVPMQPVARIFDSGKSYYINRAGKHITADHRFRANVPIVSGKFSGDFQPVSALPLLDYISGNKKWRESVTMIKAESPTSFILVPSIMGHVINVGDVNNLDDKFERIEKFYKKVLPVKGWNYYDSISVKWDGQVVATKRNKPVAVKLADIEDESEQELPEENPVDVMTIAPDKKNPETSAVAEKEKSAAPASTDKKKSTTSASADKKKPTASASTDKKKSTTSASADKKKSTTSASADKKKSTTSASADKKKSTTSASADKKKAS